MKLQAKLASQGHRFGIGTLWRFVDHHGIHLEKDRARRREVSPRTS